MDLLRIRFNMISRYLIPEKKIENRIRKSKSSEIFNTKRRRSNISFIFYINISSSLPRAVAEKKSNRMIIDLRFI
jgi:hypothetical protein